MLVQGHVVVIAREVGEPSLGVGNFRSLHNKSEEE